MSDTDNGTTIEEAEEVTIEQPTEVEPDTEADGEGNEDGE